MSAYLVYPSPGGSSGSSGVTPYPNRAAFPSSSTDGAVAIAQDTDIIYVYNTGSASWIIVAGPNVILGIGAIDSQTKSTTGAVDINNTLVLQTADINFPGLVSTGSQTIAGAKTFTGNISAANLSGTNSGDVILGTASGLSLSGANNQTLNLALASTSTTGALSSTDWNTFNGKQASGNYITALTGDGTASGPGSAALTLATVNANVGSFTYGSFTVNGKGLITAASNGTAPVTSLTVASSHGFTGSFTAAPTPVLTLAMSITGVLKGNGTSILQAVSGTDYSAGTSALATGILKSTTTTGALTIAVAADFPLLNQNTSGSAASLSATLVPTSGGTGLATYTTGDILYASATNVLSKLAIGSTGNVLTVASGLPSWAASGGATTWNYLAKTSAYTAVVGTYYGLSSASFITTLPTAVGIAGQIFAFEHQGTSLTQVYTFNTTSAQTIGGVTSGGYALYTNGEVLQLISDGANWQIAYHYAETDWSTTAATVISAVTTAPVKGVITTDSVQWRRSGRICYVKFRYVSLSTGSSTSGSGDYLFGLPVSADTTVIPVNTSAGISIDNPSQYASFIPGSYSAINVISSTAHIFKGGNVGVLYSATQFRVSGVYDSVDANIDSTHTALNGQSCSYSFDLYYTANGWQP